MVANSFEYFVFSKPITLMSKLFAATLGALTLASLLATPPPSNALEKGLVKSIDVDNETLLDVKAIKNGKIYDVKIIANNSCTDDTDPCLHSVKAFINGQKLPVKAVMEEPNDKISIKAISPGGELIDVKALDSDGDLIDVKALQVKGSFMNPVKAIKENGEILAIKGIHQSGEVFDIKAISMNNGTKRINGFEYISDIKAVEN